jgi:hypothetical protein
MQEEIVLKNVRTQDVSRLIARINASKDFRIVKWSKNLSYIVPKNTPCPPEVVIGTLTWGEKYKFSEPCFDGFVPQAYLGVIRDNDLSLINYNEDDSRKKQLESHMPALRTMMETCWWGE